MHIHPLWFSFRGPLCLNQECLYGLVLLAKLMFDLPRIPAVTMVSVQAATSVLLMLTRETLCQLTKQTLTSLLNVSKDLT